MTFDELDDIDEFRIFLFIFKSILVFSLAD